MVGVKSVLYPLSSQARPLQIRNTLERYDLDPKLGLRAAIRKLENTRPRMGAHFQYTDAQIEQIERTTEDVVDNYVKLDNGKWYSYIHKNVIEMKIDVPSTLSDLEKILKDANSDGRTVKAVGSGHSFSDIYCTDGWLVDTHKLSGEIPLNYHWLKERLVGINNKSIDASNELVQIKAGTTIEAVNRILDDMGKGLLNMGGYDGQTFVGAAATSTHGTGIDLPPFCDMILSLVLVAEKGQVFRIEPENGITNPTRYPSTEPVLIQDDDIFYSMIVSLGCMGIIYSVIIQVRSGYYLEETQSVLHWNDLSEELRSNHFKPNTLTDNRHVNILVNPYVSTETHGLHRDSRMCLLSTMNEVPNVLVEGPARRGDSHIEVEAGRGIRFLDAEHLAQEFNVLFDASVLLPYASKSFKAFISGGKEIGGYAAEWSFPLTEYHEAMEVIFETLSKCEEAGEQLQCAPISLRYVKKSKAYLSPQYGRESCMIELLNLYGTPGWPNDYVLMHRYYDALIELGGRPHWGLEFNDLSTDPDFVKALYPMWEKWLSVYKEFNSTGVFNNRFTDRLGISI